jgi:hypothetical protein
MFVGVIKDTGVVEQTEPEFIKIEFILADKVS